MERPTLRFWQMFNMSFGFLGIQFGWGLQLANMSAVYERLGARSDQVPLLWLPPPPPGAVGAPNRRAPRGPPPGGAGGPPPPLFSGGPPAAVPPLLLPPP